MSASREKQVRREQREQGTEKRQVAQKDYVKQKKRNRTITSIVAAVVVIALLAVIVLNSNLFYTQMTAVRIGNENYTASEFNYYYYTSYYSFASMYGDMISYFLDPSQPLDSQQYSEDQTWADYFRENAIETMRETQLLCDEAEKAGFTLPAEDKESLDAAISGFSTTAAEGGYSNVNQYLAAAYGRGCSLKTVSRLMERGYLASAYYNEVYNGFEYSHEELDAYYQQKTNTYDSISYISYFCSGTANEDEGIDAETAMSNAEELANSIAGGSADEEAFKASVKDLADEEVEATATRADSLPGTYSEFLLSADRKAGDCEVFSTDYGYYAVMYLGRDDNHYNTVSVRHILIMAEADENGEYTDEAKDAALEELEGIYDEWKSGDKTEESFAELANQYSDDGGSNTNGGLYENIYKNKMVKNFNDFCFDSSRKPGDTEIVYGESGSYAGYHLIYFVGESDELYSDTLADNDLRSEDYSEWREAGLTNYPATTKFSMRFAG